MKIYAITKGIYSDYHICALTINKKKAENMKKFYTDSDDEAEIEVFEDDETEDEVRIPWYYNYKTDKAFRYKPFWEVPEIDNEIEEEVLQSKDGTIEGVRVLAINEESAKKKAQEMIAMYKAKKEGLL